MTSQIKNLLPFPLPLPFNYIVLFYPNILQHLLHFCLLLHFLNLGRLHCWIFLWFWNDLQIVELHNLSIIQHPIDSLNLLQLVHNTAPDLLVPLCKCWFDQFLSHYLPFFEIMIRNDIFLFIQILNECPVLLL